MSFGLTPDHPRYSASAIDQLWEQRDLAVYCGDAQICHCGIWSATWDDAFKVARHIVETHNAPILIQLKKGETE